MKIAVIHDWLVTNAGAEKVLTSILKLYPEADVYSLVDFLSPQDRSAILDTRKVQTSFIQKLPFAKKHFRNYLPLFALAIESFKLERYDLIISSSHAVAKGIKKSQRQIHVCYCHTPMRYAWDMYDEYTKELSFFKKLFVQATLKYLRRWDYRSASRVDHFIANSHFIAGRIKKFYGRDAIVINPPVDTNKFKLQIIKEDFYLTASRLVPYKKTKLIVEAFNELGKPLVVIGSGEEYEKLKDIAKENITLLGYVEDHILIEYMQRAKAFVYAALEDFGIIPIEAMACGTPVIAYGKGGILDSVIDNKTGLFFKDQNQYDIIQAILDFEQQDWDNEHISNHVSIFSKEKFEQKFSNFINTVIDCV